ncbi:MAG: alkaline shock response membrane anchor protein AmaP [Candidatus Omnitrophica bacterium]|nr:alkaline shock response membrane anchor protein AmaP [Candidatus Omnitrophota bacterium]
MSFFRSLVIRFYAAVLILIGLAIIVFALNLLPLKNINEALLYIQSNPHARIITGLSGLLLIVISSFLAQLILGTFQREKTIAFATSSGEVTIALSAVEDLIKRLTGIIPEIKELRPDVRATRKDTILVDLRVVLKSEANIPDLTARLQEITRAKIQEVLGLEGQIIIKIHVAKIITTEEKERKRRDSEKDEPTIPYGGYIRT